MQIKGANK